MNTFPQASYWRANQTFSFRVPDSKRAVMVKEGQRFWVTNSQVNQASVGVIRITRMGTGSPGLGWAFSEADFVKHFTLLDT